MIAATRKAFAATVALILNVIVCVGCSTAQSSLGNYNGSLKDLFPENVGEFKRVLVLKANIPSYLKAKDSYGVEYAYESERCGALVYALNFSSADEAREGLKVIRSRELSGVEPVDKLTRLRGIDELSEGSKKKGLITVGDRLEARGKLPPQGRTLVVLWTNGSVLFYLEFGRGPGSKVRCEEDIFNFEHKFPY